ncbi:hypothetical protein [Sporomusa sphaeroides]|jgi:hypothetical protein|uniref:hypothetical protein n=1 Tax=Sporomusa sphaeroides TaxID=47679 RepID=UPI002CE7BA58|nr:hypothetical protein [Sporomusa sphaeroides]HML35183.1 hypothetical protein [Sporomusa sphaeroides]
MDRLILEAYDYAKSNEFFAITTMLERLINRRYSRSDSRGDITTGQVRQVLEYRGMDYTLARDHQSQEPVADIGRRTNRKRTRRGQRY